MINTPSPSSPLAAVTHPDPYPYYAELVKTQPFYYDSNLEMWVASSAEVVTAVLTHPMTRVRPSSQLVPKPLLGTATGAIFERFIRMNDGDYHQKLKPAITTTLSEITPDNIRQLGRYLTRNLLQNLSPIIRPGEITSLALRLPIYLMASLLGLQETQLPSIADAISDFVNGVANPTALNTLEAANRAADYLLESLTRLTDGAGNSVMNRLQNLVGLTGYSEPVTTLTNAIGFLFQSYEATAGLISNCYLALATNDELQMQIRNEPEIIGEFIQEVLRYDPPVQNTRRFPAEDMILAGNNLKANDTILVLVAAANRDPAANHEPQHFELFRPHREIFTFGRGNHTCPGHNLATIVAQSAIEELIRTERVPKQPPNIIEYRPSINIRIPIL